MARKADVKGGNGDVVFDTETGTARKYLRNTSTVEKVARFKRELAVFQELCKNPIPKSDEQNSWKEQPTNKENGSQKSLGHLKGAKTIAR